VLLEINFEVGFSLAGGLEVYVKQNTLRASR
jgi:hypothetical protein